MSLYKDKYLSLAGINLNALTEAELNGLTRELLESRIHGVCFSAYTEGQGPGTELAREQIAARLEVVAPHTRWIRSFSCTEGNELIPGVAKALGLKTMVGVWLEDDEKLNERELAKAIELAAQGQVDILAVGNEVLLRDDLPETALINYIRRAKAALPNVPVGYVDAYFKFVDHPAVTEACDVILANCYPFWEGCPAEHALPYMKDMYRRAQRVAGNKPVIVSETGWPSIGTPYGGGVPSAANALKYFIDTFQWAEEENIEVFYFSAFDEAWKVDKEGDVGAFWGIWDKDGQPKLGV